MMQWSLTIFAAVLSMLLVGCIDNEVSETKDAEKLHELDNVALFAAVTDADAVRYEEAQRMKQGDSNCIF